MKTFGRHSARRAQLARCLLLVVVGALAACDEGGSRLEAARRARDEVQPVEARRLFEEVWTDETGSLADRLEAGRALARLLARVFDEPERAQQVIDEVVDLDPNNVRSLTYRAAIERVARALRRREDDGAASDGTCCDERRASAPIRSFVMTVLAESRSESWRDHLGSELEPDQRADVELAITSIGELLGRDPGQRHLLRIQFELAVLAGQGDKALEAWARYFHLATHDDAGSSLPAVNLRRLSRSLRGWEGERLEPQQREDLATRLSVARVYPLTAAVLRGLPADRIAVSPEIRMLLRYERFLDSVSTAVVAHYRSIAIEGDSKSRAERFTEVILALAEDVWRDVAPESRTAEFTRDRFLSDMNDRFGAGMRLGKANGWFSLTWGHVVIEFDQRVEQYGFGGVLRFRSLDFEVSNGFMNWYLDDHQYIGGWKTEGDPYVYQVRPIYVRQPYLAWRSVTASGSGTEGSEDQESEATADAGVIPQSTLERMLLDGRRDLLRSLENRHSTQTSLREAYLRQYEKLTLEHAILAHEGRHGIDFELSGGLLSSDELEFRAKLSEIAFSSHPKIALAAILRFGTGRTPMDEQIAD